MIETGRRPDPESKSGRIRTLLANNPDVGPSQIVRIYKDEFGEDVTAGLVNQVKAKMRASVLSPVVSSPIATTSPGLNIEVLAELKRISRQLGGKEQVVKLLDLLS